MSKKEKKLIFHNEYQRQLFIDGKKKRVEQIERKIKKLQQEKEMWLSAINSAKVEDEEIIDELRDNNER